MFANVRDVFPMADRRSKNGIFRMGRDINKQMGQALGAVIFHTSSVLISVCIVCQNICKVCVNHGKLGMGC